MLKAMAFKTLDATTIYRAESRVKIFICGDIKK